MKWKELNVEKCKIGCLNWKEEKAKKLMNLYLEESNGNDEITIEQVILAESKMIANELKTSSTYEDWNNRTEYKNWRYDNFSKNFCLFIFGIRLL